MLGMYLQVLQTLLTLDYNALFAKYDECHSVAPTVLQLSGTCDKLLQLCLQYGGMLQTVI